MNNQVNLHSFSPVHLETLLTISNMFLHALHKKFHNKKILQPEGAHF